MQFNEDLLAKTDLNLLVVFMVIFREGSVSRAANFLDVHQPAVSGSLARLRQLFDDPLFLRTAHGVLPTPKAERIAQVLLPTLTSIEAVLVGDI